MHLRGAVLAALVLVMALGMAHAYSDYSFEALVKVNPDGSAHVTEKSIFFFDNNEERTEFDNNLNLGESTILEWKQFSRNVKYHVSGAIENTRITAKKEFSISVMAGAVVLDYDVHSPIFILRPEGSRRTIYTLDEKSLGFDVTKTGETILGNNMKFILEMPKDAEVISVAPPADVKETNRLTWNGPVARRWELQFAREIPLSAEVNAFFSEAFKQLTEGTPLLLLIAFTGIVGYILLKFRNK